LLHKVVIEKKDNLSETLKIPFFAAAAAEMKLRK